MSQLRGVESMILYNEKLRKNKGSVDPFVEHLREILPRDGNWEVIG
ncbi:hypothetical protein [Ferroplasma sp.]|nr:hypothetical protein [Ferroplasma sp.]